MNTQKHPRPSEGVGHVLFYIGALAKGVDGALEVLGGLLLLVVRPDQINRLVRVLTQHELSEDRHDPVAQYLLHSAQQLTGGTWNFAAAYLLWHGVVKIALIGGLLMKRRWAYPAAIGAFSFFVAYELYRYWHTRSPELLVLSLIDVFVIVLTSLEYRRLLHTHGFKQGGILRRTGQQHR